MSSEGDSQVGWVGTQVALLSFDPGATTGVVWGIFPAVGCRVVGGGRVMTSSERVLAGELVGSEEITGSPVDQARALLARWAALRRMLGVAAGLEPGGVAPGFVVRESFQVRGVGPGMGHKDVLWPEWVSWAFEGYRRGVADEYGRGGWGPVDVAPIVTVTPADKNRVKDDRLRSLGLWWRGREHARAASRVLVQAMAQGKV